MGFVEKNLILPLIIPTVFIFVKFFTRSPLTYLKTHNFFNSQKINFHALNFHARKESVEEENVAELADSEAAVAEEQVFAVDSTAEAANSSAAFADAVASCPHLARSSA